MLADAEISIPVPRVLCVATEAIVDSGQTKTVFVQRSGAGFDVRKVETGKRFDKYVEITAGLKEGERIAVSGTFLLDSADRLTSSPN